MNSTDDHEVKVLRKDVVKVVKSEQKPNLLSFFKDEGKLTHFIRVSVR